MKFRIKDLEKYLKGKIEGEKLAEILTLKSFEASYEKGVLDVDILPNRYPDAASLIGLAQEISSLTGIKTNLPKIDLKESNEKSSNYLKVVNQTKERAPYYFGRIILNVKNQPSPDWLKNFVRFYGFNSVNFLVDLANWVMIEYGAPLHIFDLDKIKGKIFVRLTKKGEKFISLEGKEYRLNGEEIVIADEEKILGLAGIKGSKTAEVSLKTKNIFIEAAVFSPERIYATSRRLNLRTEASFRFERKVAPVRSLQALQRVSSLIQKNLGGEVLSGVIGQTEIKPKKLKFNLERLNKFSAVTFSKKEVEKILRSLRIKLVKNYLVIPEERLDLDTEEDIIEEIIRVYGWNKIKEDREPIFNEIFIEEIFSFQNFLRKVLTKLGYSEAHNYNFFGEREKENFSDFVLNPIEVLNPISENYKYFQFTLIPNLLKAVNLNQFHFKEIRLFEISKTGFLEKNLPKEEYKLGVVYANSQPELILKEIKGVLNILSQELNLDFDLKDSFIFEGMSNKILASKEDLGFLGLVPKNILKNFDVDLNVGVLELNIEKLKHLASLEKKFSFWGNFPEVRRDLSFLIDEKMKFSQIKRELTSLKVNFLKKIELIDIYFPGIENKKSMTIKFVFQNPERNLKSEEVDQELEKIKNFLKEKFKIEVR